MAGPNTLTLLLPPDVSLFKTKPLPLNVSGGRLTWYNRPRPSGKVSVTVSVGDQVLAGSTLSATASLTDGFGRVSTSSVSVLVK